MSLPLPELFARALNSASKSYNLPTIEDETQDLISSSMSDLSTLSSRVNVLSLFSPNETLEDISTKDLIYLLVPYVHAEVQGRMRAIERDERLISLNQAQTFVREFLDSLGHYDIIPEDERLLYQRKTSLIIDPVKRRDIKIKQYQKEKDLRGRIEAIWTGRSQSPRSESLASDFDLILSLLPLVGKEEEENSDDSEILREAIILLLRLAYLKAHSNLESMDQELELLHNAPPPSPVPASNYDEDESRGTSRANEDMWRLDASLPGGGPDGKGPLLDASGKPLRPFTILPAEAFDRARLQAQVFGPGYRLPTMTIDEYLQIERERGNIITGGGPASEMAQTSSERLALDAEQEGTVASEESAERKRLKDENWARFKDENPRGAGNTMNRG